MLTAGPSTRENVMRLRPVVASDVMPSTRPSGTSPMGPISFVPIDAFLQKIRRRSVMATTMAGALGNPDGWTSVGWARVTASSCSSGCSAEATYRLTLSAIEMTASWSKGAPTRNFGMLPGVLEDEPRREVVLALPEAARPVAPGRTGCRA